MLETRLTAPTSLLGFTQLSSHSCPARRRADRIAGKNYFQQFQASFRIAVNFLGVARALPFLQRRIEGALSF